MLAMNLSLQPIGHSGGGSASLIAPEGSICDLMDLKARQQKSPAIRYGARAGDCGLINVIW